MGYNSGFKHINFPNKCLDFNITIYTTSSLTKDSSFNDFNFNESPTIRLEI